MQMLKAVQERKEQFPSKSRVRLTAEMKDPYTHIPVGMVGTVLFVDDIGTVHVHWENGFHLGACLEHAIERCEISIPLLDLTRIKKNLGSHVKITTIKKSQTLIALLNSLKEKECAYYVQ